MGETVDDDVADMPLPMHMPVPPADLGVPPFAMVATAYGRREDALALQVSRALASRHLSWRRDVARAAQLTSRLSSPDVAPSHAWVVPVGSREAAEEVASDLDRTLRIEGARWIVSRFLLRTGLSAGAPAPDEGVCRIQVIRGPTEVVEGIDKPVDAWWSELERWEPFRGAALYREDEPTGSNTAIELAWLDPWADLPALEAAADGWLEPVAHRLSLQTWHFRVSALYPGDGGDPTTFRSATR